MVYSELQNVPFYVPKRRVLGRETGHFRARNGTFLKAMRRTSASGARPLTPLNAPARRGRRPAPALDGGLRHNRAHCIWRAASTPSGKNFQEKAEKFQSGSNFKRNAYKHGTGGSHFPTCCKHGGRAREKLDNLAHNNCAKRKYFRTFAGTLTSNIHNLQLKCS